MKNLFAFVLFLFLDCFGQFFAAQIETNPQKIFDGDPNESNFLRIKHLFQNESNLLSTNGACKNEIPKLCGNDPKVLGNNYEILNCLFEQPEFEQKLSNDCHNQIWNFKMTVTKSDYFVNITKNICRTMLDANQNCLQSIAKNESNLGADQLSCLIDLVQPETDENCKLYLQQMELIIFSDYRLINKFMMACESNIKQLKCGRIDFDFNVHSQNNTIQCLQNHLDQLASVCHDEIIKISELQSNDIHLDKPLFLACRADREKFCANIKSGNGRIYRCLTSNIDHPDMDDDCKKKMIEREMLISKDYKISRSLEQSCKHHIKSFECRKNAKGRKQIRLSQILLCLEGAHAKGLLIVPECKAEMLLHRRFLFENYKLTPDLVSYCHRDIERFCSNVEFGAKTLHCLMKNVRPNRRRGDAHLKQRISNECERQIEDLLKEVNIAEDWRVDPILQQACQSTVNELCSNIRPGDGRILSCLADHIESARMADDCREYLHQMQYFISRNFELDTEIYEACQSDALKYCHAKSSWNSNDFDPERGPTVIGCLYRYVYQLDFKIQLQPKCIFHIKRVMKNRAASVDLLPFIEIPCIQDLAKFCSSEQVEKKGYEMECLQENYHQLKGDCKIAIGNFTEAQSSNFELNFPLFRSCLTVVKELCVEEYENSNGKDSYEVIECLIKKKNHFRIKSNRKCHQAIEHYQKINSEDFHFDHRFKESCKMDIQKNCQNLRTKYDVINCLSILVYQNDFKSNRIAGNDENPNRISKRCFKILREELFQLNESIDLDGGLMEACIHDRKKLCSDIEPGESHVLECLKTNLIRLTRACQRKLFHKQYIELVDNSVDYSLLAICKIAIDKYCILSDLHDVLYCLRDHRNDPGVGHNCRSLILKRLAQQNQDYRLNPRLKTGCKMEINRFCSNIISKSSPDELLDGKVIACLKKQYLHNTLSQTCEIEIINIIREVSMNIELDPALFRSCQKEIHKNCFNALDIHECLKINFLSKRIDDLQCKKEVARLIKESEADIESDTHLYQICLSDLKTFCSDVVAGHGHQLNCLATIHRNSPHRLSPECDTLIQKRMQLFEYASEIYPIADNMVQVFQMVASSPVHNYLYIFFIAIVALIFMFGLFCGRVYTPIPTSDKIK